MVKFFSVKVKFWIRYEFSNKKLHGQKALQHIFVSVNAHWLLSASSQIVTCRVSVTVHLKWEMRTFTERSQLIFSSINHLYFALHIIQNIYIPAERIATATHRHLNYFWYRF